MVHYNTCPLCGSEKIAQKFSCTDHFVSKEIFDVYRCQKCSFVFTNGSPAENEIGKYYESDDYISHSNTADSFSNKIYHLVRNLMLLRKKGIVKKASRLKTGFLLDIGSGTGHFAGTMKAAGWSTKGIEINEKARDFSTAKFGLEVIGTDKISSIRENSFDCITLWHVLEHFHDPFQYASEILRLLKPNGVCIVALPNSSSQDAKHYGPFWAAFDVPRHLWHFTPATFKTFSEKAGFKVEKLMNLPLDVFYISIMSEKYKGSKLSFLKGMITALPFAFLSLFNLKKSSSVIYILRKNPL